MTNGNDAAPDNGTPAAKQGVELLGVLTLVVPLVGALGALALTGTEYLVP